MDHIRSVLWLTFFFGAGWMILIALSGSDSINPLLIDSIEKVIMILVGFLVGSYVQIRKNNNSNK
jgi:hypothetical protein